VNARNVGHSHSVGYNIDRLADMRVRGRGGVKLKSATASHINGIAMKVKY